MPSRTSHRRAKAILAAGLLATAFAACGEDEQDTAPGATQQAGRPYPEEVRANFVASCEKTSNGNTAYCECTLDELQKTMSLEEFMRYDVAVRRDAQRPADLQAQVEAAIALCRASQAGAQPDAEATS